MTDKDGLFAGRQTEAKEEKRISSVIVRKQLLCSECNEFEAHSIEEKDGTLVITCLVCRKKAVLKSSPIGWWDEKFGPAGLLVFLFGVDDLGKVVARSQEGKVKP